MTSTSPIRIVVADDHLVLLRLLVRMLEKQSDMAVVGHASDADAALQLLYDEKPQVIVLDITMPGGGGMRVLQHIARNKLGTRSLVLSGADQPGLLPRVMHAGGHGFITKSADSPELLGAIRAVAAGRFYFSAPMSPALTSSVGEVVSSLSEREHQVLVRVALGFTSKEIANTLGIAQTTVEMYRSRVSKKIGARSRSELVRFALRARLLDEHIYEEE